MKLSELAALLGELQKQYGDVDFVIEDADTGWVWEINENHFLFSTGPKKTGAAIALAVTYSDSIDYDWPVASQKAGQDGS